MCSSTYILASPKSTTYRISDPSRPPSTKLLGCKKKERKKQKQRNRETKEEHKEKKRNKGTERKKGRNRQPNEETERNMKRNQKQKTRCHLLLTLTSRYTMPLEWMNSSLEREANEHKETNKRKFLMSNSPVQHLVHQHQHRFQRKSFPAKIEERSERRAQQIHHQNVVKLSDLKP